MDKKHHHVEVDFLATEIEALKKKVTLLEEETAEATSMRRRIVDHADVEIGNALRDPNTASKFGTMRIVCAGRDDVIMCGCCWFKL